MAEDSQATASTSSAHATETTPETGLTSDAAADTLAATTAPTTPPNCSPLVEPHLPPQPADPPPSGLLGRAAATVIKSPLLEYETQQLLELLAEDGLLVAARGLGAERLLAACARVLSDPGELVLVLGTSRPEEEHVVARLEEEGVRPLPRAVTADTSVTDRQQVYLSGGVLFVTSRILVVDLLIERCPADLVTGVLVWRAHTIVESAQEAFILRLYRQKNKTGFIKAISSSPLSFTSGFCQVQRVMRNMFVRNLYLWPRFHLQVSETLKKCQPEVVEIRVRMTPLMISIQAALLDLIDVTVKEFKRLNPSLDWDTLTVETVISRSFYKQSRMRLDPVWHQLSGRTRQLVSDLRTLRALLAALPQHDCCAFYQLVAAQQSTERALSSGWALLDAAETVFVDARKRVFGDAQPAAKKARTETPVRPRVLHMEEPPKWHALSEVLSEVRRELAAPDAQQRRELAAPDEQQRRELAAPDAGHGEAVTTEKVLVVAADLASCRRIKQFLTSGSQAVLWRQFQQLLAPKFGEDAYMPPAAADEPPRAAVAAAAEPAQQTLTQMAQRGDDTDELAVRLPSSPLVLLQPAYDSDDPYQLHRTLQLCRPKYVLLYDMDMAVVRTLEVHQASTPERAMRVYTLMFGGTTEEQAYLTSLRAEKQAFEYLIKEKANMVVPEEREGRDDTNMDLERGVDDTAATAKNTRRGGGAAAAAPPAEPPRVIVDVREFRSELPSLLHRRGVDIIPATIEVGDYIVTPDVCVERKSVSDLIGSLMSGRLYSQAQAMARHYRRPVLLIEFDQDKPFSLQGKYYLSSDVSSAQVVSRLQLLTMHFPRLRLMWCPSPYASAELLHQLKRGEPEPSLAEARAATSDRTDTLAEDRFNPQIRDLVSKLPGVRAKTLYALLNRIETLPDLLQLSKERLAEILGSPSDAAELHHALHDNLTAAGDASAAKRPTVKPGRGRAGRPRFWRGKK